MKKLALVVLMLSVVSCATVQPPPEDTESSTQQVETVQCTKGVGYPHKSLTRPNEVAAKGTLLCTRSNQALIVTATVTLYQSGVPYATAAKSVALSAVAAVEIKDYQLVAAGPCVTGNYNAVIELKAVNQQGVTVVFGQPTSTPVILVNCSIAKAINKVNVSYTNNVSKVPVGKTVTGKATFKNEASYSLAWSAVKPADATWLTLTPMTGTLAAGATASVNFTATCTKLGVLSADVQIVNDSVINQITTVKITVECLKTVKMSLRLTTPYNGSTQLCPRVKGAFDYEFIGLSGTFRWQFLIDGTPAPVYDYADSGSTITFGMTRSCNLAVGAHNVQVKVLDAQGVVVASSDPSMFTVNSNGWAGFITNDTNNCAGVSGYPMDLSVTASGVGDQRQSAVGPGGALAVLLRGGLTYKFEGIYTGTSVGSFREYTIPTPLEGDPVSVNGRTGFVILSFTQTCPDPTLLRTQATAKETLVQLFTPVLPTPVLPQTFSVHMP